MKQIIIILFTIAVFAFLSSCEKDDEGPVLDLSESVLPQLISPEPGTVFDLEELSEMEDSISFEWTAAEYNMENLPAIKYRLQAYIVEDDSENPSSIANITDTEKTSLTISAVELNRALSNLDVIPFVPGDISFRVLAYLNMESEASWLYSEPVDLEVTTFSIIEFILVPGSYQGWDYDNESTSLITPDEDGGFFPNYSFDDGEYFEGYFYFEEANTEILFSFPGVDGVSEWGDNDGNGSLDPEGQNIVISDSGVYRIIVLLDSYTYVIEKADWALIGSAAEGWNTDVPMAVDVEYWEENWNLRYKITQEMVEGAFKFRANGAWDPPAGMNLGMAEDDDAEEGDLMYGGYGNDIPITSPGAYDIILNLYGTVYTYDLSAAEDNGNDNDD